MKRLRSDFDGHREIAPMKRNSFVLLLLVGGNLARAAAPVVYCASDAAGVQFSLTVAQGNGLDDEVRLVAGSYALTQRLTYVTSEPNALTVSGGWNVDCSTQNGGQTLLDFAHGGPESWMADGFLFGVRPTEPGDVVLGDDPQRPIRELVSYWGARQDPAWNRLRTAPGNGKAGNASTANAAAFSGVSLSRVLTADTTVRLKLQQIQASPDAQSMARGLAQAVFQGKGGELAESRKRRRASRPGISGGFSAIRDDLARHDPDGASRYGGSGRAAAAQ